jgi:spore maturation protein CgeB
LEVVDYVVKNNGMNKMPKENKPAIKMTDEECRRFIIRNKDNILISFDTSTFDIASITGMIQSDHIAEKYGYTWIEDFNCGNPFKTKVNRFLKCQE